MFDDTNPPRTAVLTYDQAVVRALEPSWLGAMVAASNRFGDRARSARDRAIGRVRDRI